ncbi:hypothetical protein [Propionimicrobium lymphophilum]|uniref:hypothetical protein n=1 Tax=Propionimicrobium lymphophilum TaxID=33012 RepID=UPI002889AADB|nr:hypothetical protein [Propionimicrobium lymphophilum]
MHVYSSFLANCFVGRFLGNKNPRYSIAGTRALKTNPKKVFCLSSYYQQKLGIFTVNRFSGVTWKFLLAEDVEPVEEVRQPFDHSLLAVDAAVGAGVEAGTGGQDLLDVGACCL